MTRAILALGLLLGCAAGSTPSRPPEPEPAAPADHCGGYCAAVLRCQPEHYFTECPNDCRSLLADREATAVSGITAALVRCWAEATSCELAVTCDAVAEGEGK